MNLARIRFFSLLLCAIAKVQTVCFAKLATAFETEAKTGSSLRRIQRFMSAYRLNTDLIARLIFLILPHKPPYRLATVIELVEIWTEQTGNSAKRTSTC